MDGWDKGALPAGSRLKASLVTRADISQKQAVRHAIGRGQMNTVFAAASKLQEVPLVINEPLRNWVWRYLAPPPFDPMIEPPACGENKRRPRGGHGKTWDKRITFDRDMVLAEHMSGNRDLLTRLDFQEHRVRQRPGFFAIAAGFPKASLARVLFTSPQSVRRGCGVRRGQGGQSRNQ